MIQNLKHAAVALLAIMLTAAASARDYDFSIPTGTPENPLLDVKYKIDMEPYTFTDVSGGIILAFHTFLCCTATYADGSVVEKRELEGNYVATLALLGHMMCGIEDGSGFKRLVYYDGELNIYEDEKLCVESCAGAAGEILYDCSFEDDFRGNSDMAETFYTTLRHPDRWQKTILPWRYRNMFGYDDITFIEYEDPYKPPEYSNPDYSLYTTYAGYVVFNHAGFTEYEKEHFSKGSFFVDQASIVIFWPVIVINDGNHTVVKCSPIQLTKADSSLTSLGTQYGYMDTIKQKKTIDFKFEDYTYRWECEVLVHIAYPKDEELKAAARAAGYDVP